MPCATNKKLTQLVRWFDFTFHLPSKCSVPHAVTPYLSLSLSHSLSLSCATLAGGGKLVKTTYRRNCAVFPTIVFTNMVFGVIKEGFVEVLGPGCSYPAMTRCASLERAAPRPARGCVRVTGAISARSALPRPSACAGPESAGIKQCPYSASRGRVGILGPFRRAVCTAVAQR